MTTKCVILDWILDLKRKKGKAESTLLGQLKTFEYRLYTGSHHSINVNFFSKKYLLFSFYYYYFLAVIGLSCDTWDL